MTRWDALTTICSYLRGGLLDGEPKPTGEIVWELMIEVASFHFVTPALARCVASNANIPSEVRDYFEASTSRMLTRISRQCSAGPCRESFAGGFTSDGRLRSHSDQG